MEHYLPDAHCFADDTQLYLSFKPLGNTAQADAIQAMEKCIDAVRKWMIQDRLMINDDKTEFLLVGTRQQLDKLDSCSRVSGKLRPGKLRPFFFFFFPGEIIKFQLSLPLSGKMNEMNALTPTNNNLVVFFKRNYFHITRTH